MGLVENVMTSVNNYWTPKEIKQFAEDVSAYRIKVLEHRNDAPIVQLASLEERARKLDGKYLNGMYLGVVSAFAGLALVKLDWM